MSAVGGRRGVGSTSVFFCVVKRGCVANAALEHLLVGLPKVLREESVYDGIHRGIAVRQAVGCDSEEEGGGGQRENPKLSPEIDDVVRQPGYPKNHDHYQNRLRGLEGEGDKRKRVSYNRRRIRSLKHALSSVMCVAMESDRH